MHLKHAIVGLCCFLGLLFLNSCLGDSDLETVIVSDDAQLFSFTLKSDSVSELASVVFTIDQLNGRIFNQDSMSYGTDFSTRKAVMSFQLASASAYLEVLGDTIYASGDSIDISAKALDLMITAENGVKKKNYEFWINIHTVDPDSVYYSQRFSSLNLLDSDETKAVYFGGAQYIFTKNNGNTSLYKLTNNNNPVNADWVEVPLVNFPQDVVLSSIRESGSALYASVGTNELFVSYNVASWEVIPVPYKIISILGYLHKSSIQKEGLAAIVEFDGKTVFGFTSDFDAWTIGAEVPSSFPVTGFESQSYAAMNTQRLLIFGGKNQSGVGLNSVWSTEDGLYWAKLNTDESSFPVLEQFNALVYNGELFVLNGKLADGKLNETVYYSPDGGNTWKSEGHKADLPENYTERYGATVIKDDKEVYFYIIGGKNDGNLTDIWAGYKNEYLFDE